MTVGLNVVQGEAADRGWPLGVKEKQEPGDAVFGSDRVVVEQAAGLLHLVSASMTPLGPPHLVAANSRLVSFWALAQRTKFPAVRRWVA